MPATKASIFNMALAHCGVGLRIQDPDNESGKEPENCRLFYDQVREIIIEAAEWPFLTERVELQDLGTPPDGWLFRYKYPNNCRRVNRIVNPLTRTASPSSPKIPYAIKNLTDAYGRALVCDQEDAILEFNRDIDDPALMSSTFNQAHSIGLAAHIAMPLRVDVKIADRVTAQWNGWLAEALAQTMREQQEDPEQLSQFETGRA